MTTPKQNAETLRARLEAGYAKIDEGMRQDQNTEPWVDFWLRLLREYEELCDQMTQGQIDWTGALR
jgi:hypothetical protein